MAEATGRALPRERAVAAAMRLADEIARGGADQRSDRSGGNARRA